MEYKKTAISTRGVVRKASAYLAKNFRYVREEPGFFWMKTMARFEFARELAATGRSVSNRCASAASSKQVRADHSFPEILEILKRDGYYVGLRLTSDTVAALQEATRTTACYADRESDKAFFVAERRTMETQIGRPIRIANYFDHQEVWPVFQSLRQDPLLLAIADAYLGRAPVYLRSDLFWSFAAASNREEQLAAAQVFHCDINDFRTLKFFFHLSDVGPDDGPHVYIKKGPRRRTLFHQLLGQRITSLPETSILSTYQRNEIVPIHGDAGLGFAGDPYYFHKGQTPQSGSRLLMQLEFGCKRYRMWYLY